MTAPAAVMTEQPRIPLGADKQTPKTTTTTTTASNNTCNNKPMTPDNGQNSHSSGITAHIQQLLDGHASREVVGSGGDEADVAAVLVLRSVGI